MKNCFDWCLHPFAASFHLYIARCVLYIIMFCLNPALEVTTVPPSSKWPRIFLMYSTASTFAQQCRSKVDRCRFLYSHVASHTSKVIIASVSALCNAADILCNRSGDGLQTFSQSVPNFGSSTVNELLIHVDQGCSSMP